MNCRFHTHNFLRKEKNKSKVHDKTYQDSKKFSNLKVHFQFTAKSGEMPI